MRVCLDTNAYSNLRRGNVSLQALLDECDEIIVPAVVYAELMYGFLHGSRFAENASMLNDFLAEDGISFYPATQSIAERWGYVKSVLAKKGTPIPENDIWVAATALETGARLISYDRHFDHVGGLIRLTP